MGTASKSYISLSMGYHLKEVMVGGVKTKAINAVLFTADTFDNIGYSYGTSKKLCCTKSLAAIGVCENDGDIIVSKDTPPPGIPPVQRSTLSINVSDTATKNYFHNHKFDISITSNYALEFLVCPQADYYTGSLQGHKDQLPLLETVDMDGTLTFYNPHG
jgi:hypothetical protein